MAEGFPPDVNFIVLGELVGRVAEPLDQFARKTIYVPLGMKDSGYRPQVVKVPGKEKS